MVTPAAVEELHRPAGRMDRVTDGLAARVAAARDRWLQLTFYLLDPNSWR
jgi:hypothetical protein